jgi:cytochrome P450
MAGKTNIFWFICVYIQISSPASNCEVRSEFCQICFFNVFHLLWSISGAKWRAHRKLIAPTFHLNVLKSFIDLFNENSRYVCNKLKSLDGAVFDCHDYMSETTVNILMGE